ncbi:MAG: hypothetical protein ACSHX6_13590 [Akkermansiaceae bacterium]
MKLAPTLQGGLRIDADSLEDWMVLDAICADAASLPGAPLYDRLSEKMPKDPDWEEFVAPDIRSQFSDQVTHVSRALSAAPMDEDQAGSIFISKDDAPIWYGALNQARMTLEHIYQISELDEFVELDELGDIGDAKRSAVIRSHFYSTFQCLLLDYVLD